MATAFEKGADLRKPTQVLAEDLVEVSEITLRQKSVFSRVPSIEDFIYLQNRASQNFVCADMYEEAGDCKVHIAEAELQMGNKPEAASFYAEAAKLYRLGNPSAAALLFETAVALYCDIGRFDLAGVYEEICADIARDAADHGGAAVKYAAAGEFHLAALRHSAWVRCLEHVAERRCVEGEAVEAHRLFLELARHAASTNMGQNSAPGILLNAGLVALQMQSPKRCRGYLEGYIDVFPLFQASPQYQFIEDMTFCHEEFDMDSFADKVYNMNAVVKFTSWQLLQVSSLRSIIDAGPRDFLQVDDRVETKLDDWSQYYGGVVINRTPGIDPRSGLDIFTFDVYFDDDETGRDLEQRLVRREIIVEDEFEIAMEAAGV